MATITAADVKKLRDKTGAGMMDCKNALKEADGDFVRAERILKELGKAAAAKRSGRATNEGRIFVAVAGDSAAMVELACETDFVARNETFVALGNEVVAEVLSRGLDEPDAVLTAKVADAISTIKENMSIQRITRMSKGENELFAEYIHGDSGRMGGIVRVRVEDSALLDSEPVRNFAFDCALHVVAFRPLFLSTEEVDPAYRKEQEEIFMTQARNMDKPEKVLPGIVQGKLRKLFAEICLLEQGFVKDEKTSVGNVAKAIGKEVGTTVSVTGFLTYTVGQE